MRLCITNHSKHRSSSSSISSPIVFHIHVEETTTNKKKKEYVICKRFRDFVDFRAKLHKEGFTLPSLPLTGPAMSLWMVWNKEEAIEHRVTCLQQFLEYINTSQDIQKSPSFQAFVGESPDQKRGYTSLSGYSTAESFRIVDLSKSSCVQLPQRRRRQM